MNRILDIALTVSNLAARAAHALNWFPPLLARGIVGLVFVQSGWGKLHALDNVVDFFRELGIPWPEIQAPFAASNELIFGALVLVGAATRFSVVPLIVVMLVALQTAIVPNLETASGILNASEFLYIALLLWLGVNGAGAVSVDALVTRVWNGQEKRVSMVGPRSEVPA